MRESIFLCAPDHLAAAIAIAAQPLFNALI
jgi:hypothetical protein